MTRSKPASILRRRHQVSNRIVALVIACWCFAACIDGAQAQHESGFIKIYQAASLDSPPKEAAFLISYGGRALNRVRAVAVPVDQVATANGRRRWFFGARINRPPYKQEISYNTIILLENGGYIYLPPVAADKGEGKLAEADPEELRTYLIEKRKEIDALTAKLSQGEANEKRLQADASVIAGVGRIVESRDEQQRIERDISDIDQGMEAMRKASAAGLSMQPKNADRRELDLTKQLSDLASIAKNVETGETSRMSQQEEDRDRDLALLEAAQNEDPEALRAELNRMQEERRELEIKLYELRGGPPRAKRTSL